MDDKKTQKFRQRLLEEYQKLIRSINRNRLAEEEIKLENTEDEGDLATISHNKELLYNLHESDFQRLKSIQEALKRMDRGEYGECVRCGEDINEKRLMAVPWATQCIQCQEEAEKESQNHGVGTYVLHGNQRPERTTGVKSHSHSADCGRKRSHTPRKRPPLWRHLWQPSNTPVRGNLPFLCLRLLEIELGRGVLLFPLTLLLRPLIPYACSLFLVPCN